MNGTIPVTLIGGYLGAGKTTLVNHLLRHADGRHLAVLVNEFGELPIDADLIEARDGNLLSISGGCICCSFGSDLLGALMQLKDRADAIDHLLIETSGVALPQSIVQSLTLLDGLAIDGVIVVTRSGEPLAKSSSIAGRARKKLFSGIPTRQTSPLANPKSASAKSSPTPERRSLSKSSSGKQPSRRPSDLPGVPPGGAWVHDSGAVARHL